MSSSSDVADSRRFAGLRAPARGPEKSSFFQTCSLLSQYIKERGTFGDLSLGMSCSLEGNGRFLLFLDSEFIGRLFWFSFLSVILFWAFYRQILLMSFLMLRPELGVRCVDGKSQKLFRSRNFIILD